MFDTLIVEKPAKYCMNCGTQIWVRCPYGFCLNCLAHSNNPVCKEIRSGKI